MSEEVAFEVVFGCNNCGDEWSREFPARTKVAKPAGTKAPHYANEDHDTWIQNCEEGCCGHVKCPTCDLFDGVHIADRNPVEEGDDDV